MCPVSLLIDTVTPITDPTNNTMDLRDLIKRSNEKLANAISPNVLSVVDNLFSKGVFSQPLRDKLYDVNKPHYEKALDLLELIVSLESRTSCHLYDAVVEVQLYKAADILNPDNAPHERYMGVQQKPLTEEYDYSYETEEYGFPDEAEEYDFPDETMEYDFPDETEQYYAPWETEEYDAPEETEEYDDPGAREEYDASEEREEFYAQEEYGDPEEREEYYDPEEREECDTPEERGEFDALGERVEYEDPEEREEYDDPEVREEYDDAEEREEYDVPEEREEFDDPEEREEFDDPGEREEYDDPGEREEYDDPEEREEYDAPDEREEFNDPEEREEYDAPDEREEFNDPEEREEYDEPEEREEYDDPEEREECDAPEEREEFNDPEEREEYDEPEEREEYDDPEEREEYDEPEEREEYDAPEEREEYDAPDEREEFNDPDEREEYDEPEEREEYDDPEEREEYDAPDEREEFNDPDEREEYDEPEEREEYDDPEEREEYDDPEEREEYDDPEEREEYDEPEDREEYDAPDETIDFDSPDERLPDSWPSAEAIKAHKAARLVDEKYTRIINLFKDMLTPRGQESIYLMSAKPRGQVLIINNEQFTHLTDRYGSREDRKSLEELFNSLDFDVKVEENKTKEELWKLLEEESRRDYHNTVQCFLLFILSHGHTGVVFGTDGQMIDRHLVNCLEIKEITDLFCRSKALQGKPKLFFIQACQGDAKNEGHPVGQTDGSDKYVSQQPAAAVPAASSSVSVTPSDNSPLSVDENCEQMKIISEAEDTLNEVFSTTQANAADYKRPSGADAFVALATIPGFVSYRNEKIGTWFIQAICYVFAKYSYRHELNKLMILVNNLVGRAETGKGRYKQVCEKKDSFQKEFYFFPGLHAEQ